MSTERLRPMLDRRELAEPWLAGMGLSDLRRGHENFVRMAQLGIPLDLLAVLAEQISRHLPRLSNPDMALNNLERFVSAVRSPLGIATLFERDAEALPTLLQIFSTSQYLSDLLVSDTESYDLLRITEGQPVSREELVAELRSEVDALSDARDVMSTLRRYKRREVLRIAYGDIVRGQPLETVTRQISHLADAIVDAAVRFARRSLEEKRGRPPAGRDGSARFVVLALGKLGGAELNYSSDIDLVCLYEQDPSNDHGGQHAQREFFERLVREMARLLSERTELGMAYRVDLRLRPDGTQGTAACGIEDALRYYDMMGRTWERQAYIRARPVAGDISLGEEFLSRMEPWIYRSYLTLADITGIKSLKRRIDLRGKQEGEEALNVKTGHGGIRDIEYVIQFLQLLNGGDSPLLRTGNTLEAIARLEQQGCLVHQERTILEENYAFLRKIEHRLQIMFDLQTHRLPEDPQERRRLAIRMGYPDSPQRPAAAAFDADYAHRTHENRRILNHLLQDAFGDDAVTEPEVDLVNDPSPSPQRIEEVLGRYPFRDPHAAYQNLMALATERIRFLSTRRCRHFLASIAPRLLKTIASTPDPDATLVSLSQVSDSLGGKSALWELMSANRPSMELYVRLCAACPYLAGILTSNPGMIDELVDSLLLGGLAPLDELEQSLAALCRGAEDIAPILHSFKDAQHLRVGVRDILGKDDIEDTHAALAATAEACVKQVAQLEQRRLTAKFGQPTVGQGPRAGQPCEWVILALGKLGGREPNYHSDLDVVFVYDGEGSTAVEPRGGRAASTTNVHFFSELGQRIIKSVSQLGPYGRLYEIDARLRPTGRSGTLAISVDEFLRYFHEGSGQLWERQSLCKGRVIYGCEDATQRVMDAVHQVAYGTPWQPRFADEIKRMRFRLEETASPHNLKRGPGGTVDIEFLVQMLQLRYGGEIISLRQSGTLPAIRALHSAGILSPDEFHFLSRSYRFLRSIEARIRLMNATGRHDLPQDHAELAKLAYLLNYDNPRRLAEETRELCKENRRLFERRFREGD